MTLCDLEKSLNAKGYKTELASYGSHDVSDTNGNILPACYRDCLVLNFRICDGAENTMASEADFLKYIKRNKTFTVYDSHSIYAGYQYVVTDKESAAELYADAKVKKMVLDEYWRVRHEMYLNSMPRV